MAQPACFKNKDSDLKRGNVFPRIAQFISGRARARTQIA